MSATDVHYTSPCKPDFENRLIDKINKRITGNEKFFSLQFFPPRTPNGTINLFEKCDRLSRGQPLFCDMTSDGTNGCNREKIDENFGQHYLDVATTTQSITMCDTMLQLNASKLTEDSAYTILMKAKQHGLSTIMAVADCVAESNKNADFAHTAELVRFIRQTFGRYFTICVAGYPSSCDMLNIPYEQTLEHLLDEINAGANFVITQMVFEASEFFYFINKCRKSGIEVPIIPGILPIQSYGCIKQVARHSNVKIPDKIMNVLKPIQQNDDSVLKYGIFLTVELCKMLLRNAMCTGLHFFTLNRERATTEVLKKVGLWRETKLERRVLPWRSASQDNEDRPGELVRPIFWSCRPGSYEHRTSNWETFPNGRWGDSSSASFGNFRDYHLFFVKNNEMILEHKMMWGETLERLEDVFDVFVAYLSGAENKSGHKVTSIPWSEEELAAETVLLSEQLIQLNRNGILTINSQPHCNCAPSNHKIFGWGNPGGYVFQKAYLEFFCSKEDARNLLKVLGDYELVHYHIVNSSGDENFTNTVSLSPNAVTWGVFTGQMILQPTVVDPVAFQSWKEEAFELWMEQWGRLYDEDSTSKKIIQNIHDEFYLANLVDNDYVKGNCLFEIVNRVISMRKV